MLRGGEDEVVDPGRGEVGGVAHPDHGGLVVRARDAGRVQLLVEGRFHRGALPGGAQAGQGQDLDPFNGVLADGDHRVGGRHPGAVDAHLVGVFDDGAPVLLGERLAELGRVDEGDHGVDGVLVVGEQDPFLAQAGGVRQQERFGLVQDALVAGDHGAESGVGVIKAQQAGFAELGAADAQHEVAPVCGELEAEPHGDVVLLVDDLVLADGRAEHVGLHLVGPPRIVHHGVEDPAAVGGEGDAVEDVLDHVRQQRAGAEVLDAQREALVPGVVHGVGIRGCRRWSWRRRPRRRTACPPPRGCHRAGLPRRGC